MRVGAEVKVLRAAIRGFSANDCDQSVKLGSARMNSLSDGTVDEGGTDGCGSAEAWKAMSGSIALRTPDSYPIFRPKKSIVSHGLSARTPLPNLPLLPPLRSGQCWVELTKRCVG